MASALDREWFADGRGAAFARLWARARASPFPAILAVGVLSRVAIVLVAVLAGSYFPQAVAEGWNRGPGFVRYFARWDSGFYMDIAEFGYGFKPEAWAFNPGYPMLLWAVHRTLPFLDLPTVGFLVSNACFLAGLCLFFVLTRRLFEDEALAWRATVFVAVFPGSFYLSAVYADALFFALLVGFLLAMHAERWLAAALLVSYAAITRPPGLFLVGALLVGLAVAWWRRRRAGEALPRRAWAALPLSLLLPALFLLYSWAATGDPWISPHTREVYWPNVEWHDPRTLRDFSGVPQPLEDLMFLGLWVVALSTAWALWDGLVRRRAGAWPVYAFCGVMAVIYFSYSEINPIMRYLISFLPAYWAAADLSRSPGVFAGLVAVAAVLCAFVTMVFATWGPLY